MKRIIFMALIVVVITITNIYQLGLEAPLEVMFLDIGQGDSVLITTPDHLKILIDTGENKEVLFDLAENSKNFNSRIDYLILTHNDEDHIGQVDEIMMYFKVQNVIVNEYMQDSKVFQKFFLGEDLHDLSVSVIEKSESMHLGCCIRLDFYYPYKGKNEKDDNQESLVFKLTYKNVTFMFLGDLSAVLEDKLCGLEQLSADVLKVSHHGSKTSTSDFFLNCLKPKVAVISVGAENNFGHPSQEVLDRIKSKAIHLFRTDEQGTITILTDGFEFSVSKEY